ncbi:MAG: DNA-formamidopyrimidine glycosylase family protein [Flavitalea sp.]
MPEGPSIIIAKEAIMQFKGKKILKATGYGKLDKKLLVNKTIRDIKTWGKHLLIVLSKELTIRVHFMLFGSYRVNDQSKTANAKLGLEFKDGELNFYVSEIVLIKEPLTEVYDWSGDIMSSKWDTKAAKLKMEAKPERLLCDVLMDQAIFSGVGNIIKNETMYKAKLHPENKIGNIPSAKLTFVAKEVARYAKKFYKWKKDGTLQDHCIVYKQEYCMVCGSEVTVKDGGKSKRRNYYCEHDQVIYV